MTGVSPFLHRYTAGGEDVFFHSLNLELYSSPDEAPDPAAEEELLSAYRSRVAMNTGIVMGTFFLTTSCPRDCGYCFLQGVAGGRMTRAEIDRGLELLGKGPADLLLYGGEPLLEQDLIEHTLAGISGSGADMNIVLATGGVPVKRQTAELLADAGAFIIVSIDGPPAVHNAARPLRGPGDSFAQAEQAFREFTDAGCRVGISVTLTRFGIDNALENFLWLMDRFNPVDMGLNPWLHPLKGGEHSPCEISGEEAIGAVTGCMEAAIERGMYIEQLARRVRPFVNKTPRLKDCASSGGRLVLVPGGTAGTCDCMTCCGDHGVSIWDNAGLKALTDSFRPLSPVNFPGCLRCPALCICGGGCRYDAFHASGRLTGTREERCLFERRFLEWMVERTVLLGRDSLLPGGGYPRDAMPMPVGTMLGEHS